MPVDSNYLEHVELIRVPFDADTITSSHVRTTMFAWCGFARACRILAMQMQADALAKMPVGQACDSPMYQRAVAYGMMAYESLDRLTLASKLADRLDAIEIEEREGMVVT